MDYLDTLGCLALGSRLKRLSERLGQEVAEVYATAGIEFEPKWFPVFRLLAEQQVASVTDIAALVGITHPAVNQFAQELTKAGLITSAADKADGRKRLLSLSATGKRVSEQLEPVWQALHRSLSEIFEESDFNLINAVVATERALDRKNLLARYEEFSPQVGAAKPEIIEFSPDLAAHFGRLNRAWIEKYFSLEGSDRKIFADPERIIQKGGFIFFVRVSKKIVGTCALVKVDSATFELAKMAVDEAYQGMGLGKLLMQKCLERAMQHKAKSVTLETNTRLKSAINMYRKFGFEQVENAPSKYQRVNLIMKLDLASAKGAKMKSAQKHAFATK